ncbi:aminodeoxychorismate synthase component I [Microbulbifer thermotolerans]|uniref:aminodeoxychorismate synthase n=1 Tax=Microbulbifer thermotolerans TaxID=252514 RepID=A0A143HLY0_MICTH|nr:aminodeoxychorismate synthase component I [Microbulbifer thermotolerans]AMX02517.1 para-aminobenzoate synthase [Microbulbifer thermotolerans]MCX2795008.1 aminodeoxychorismate synthase component I [Microbulbifer thermotolerans]MCX2800576.1 aminodeoxychorismate synthase component I [Microbulbifer thermotolerans]MCX2831200.1 aminodeoxychorismate synthase component I [Microbulbifer thermotolerans]MCX2833680.1 aminodeoxychorismate synthase component I [Microbulbifer thermotolerans]
MRIVSLPYSTNTAAAFQAVADLPAPVWLDSGRPLASGGRYDIISADPIQTLKLPADSKDPFVQLDDLLCELCPQDMDAQLPFCGGVIGYAGYELGMGGNYLPLDTRQTGLPAGFFGLYSWALIVDHKLEASHLVFHPASTQVQIDDLQARFAAVHWRIAPYREKFRLLSAFEHELSPSEYQARIAKILNYIAAGDIYQANFTQRFSAAYEGDLFTAYLALRECAAGPFSAYLSLPEGSLLSLSPERFIRADGGNLQTEPIKGTAERSADPAEDGRRKITLLKSAKDKAENLMIVDLLRNDLGKLCTPGSVRVPELFRLASFANVHHLVSTITGELPQDHSFAELLGACFPGGSITGAPKRRAMQIIRELELSPRGAYCGSVGYISCCGRADTNIAIRTFSASGGRISCGAGGGIVADSDPAEEHLECLAKIRLMLETLEQLD